MTDHFVPFRFVSFRVFFFFAPVSKIRSGGVILAPGTAARRRAIHLGGKGGHGGSTFHRGASSSLVSHAVCVMREFVMVFFLFFREGTPSLEFLQRAEKKKATVTQR